MILIQIKAIKTPVLLIPPEQCMTEVQERIKLSDTLEAR